MAAGFAYLGGASAMDEIVRQPALEIIPVAPQDKLKGEAFDGEWAPATATAWCGPSPSGGRPRRPTGK